MKKRNVLVPLFLLALVFIVFLVRRWNEPRQKEAFDRVPGKLAYSGRARCQMACRSITTEDINEIMQKGIINFNQSNKMARPCPVFALQGRTTGGKSLRVFFSQCPQQSTVIACFRLKQTDDCYCPEAQKTPGK